MKFFLILVQNEVSEIHIDASLLRTRHSTSGKNRILITKLKCMQTVSLCLLVVSLTCDLIVALFMLGID